jgi:hypothetical protein
MDVADNLDRPSRSEAGSGIPVLQVKRSVADAIVRGSSTTIAGLEEKATVAKTEQDSSPA